MKYVGIVLGVIILYFVLGYTLAGLGILELPLFRLHSQIHMNRDVIQKTYNADNAIYNYEWFKERYEAIQAIDNKIKNAEIAKQDFETSAGDRSQWTFEDKTEDARLSTVVLGLKQQREDLIAEYNARAKMANRNIFQDRLPLFINL